MKIMAIDSFLKDTINNITKDSLCTQCVCVLLAPMLISLSAHFCSNKFYFLHSLFQV
eukprot:c44767_g1_i1 orf=3-170(-)